LFKFLPEVLNTIGAFTLKRKALSSAKIDVCGKRRVD
jgi:hypothetical protein